MPNTAAHTTLHAIVETQIVLRVRFNTSSRVTKRSQHEADGCKFQERNGVAVEIFPVLGDAAIPHDHSLPIDARHIEIDGKPYPYPDVVTVRRARGALHTGASSPTAGSSQ